jgi:hypothetical protein
MNKFESITDETASHSTRLPNDGNLVAGYKPLRWFMALLLAAVVAGCGGGGGDGIPGVGTNITGGVCTGASCVSLGTASDYAIFADTGIANATAPAAITGNMGVGPGVTSTAISGPWALNLPAGGTFSTSTQVNGRIYAFDYAPPTPTKVNTASLDMGAAYTAAAGKPAGVGPKLNLGGGTVSGQNLAPGTYTWGGNVTIPTDLTLTGNPNAVWIFQIAGTLDMAAAKNVILAGGAQAKNIFWQVSGAVTIGANTNFKGIILGQTSITLGSLASIKGRLLAQTNVALDQNTVTVP